MLAVTDAGAVDVDFGIEVGGLTTAEQEVARFLRRCGVRRGDAPAWLVAMRRRQADIARLTGGRPWIIELAIGPTERLRIGITAEGVIVSPLAPGGEVDVHIRGSAPEVVGFLLGEGSLERAMVIGTVVLRSPATAPIEAFRRLRDLTAGELRRVAAGPVAAGMLFVRRASWKVQSWAEALNGLVDRMGPAFVAAAIVMTASSATSMVIRPAGASRPAATTSPSAPDAVTATSIDAARDSSTTQVQEWADAGRTAPAGTRHEKGGVATGTGATPRTSETLTTVIDGNKWNHRFEQEDPTPIGPGETYLFIEVSCDSDAREAVCNVMRSLPDEPKPAT